MSITGVQADDGSFNRQVIDDILDRIEDRAVDRFGENVDLSQGSPIKQLLDVVVYEHEYVWQLMEDVYYAAYYETAYEEQLDRLLDLTQFTRLSRRGATGRLTFSVQVANTHDILIPEGTRVSTYETENTPPIPFKTTEPARLLAGHNSVGGVPIRALEPWEATISEEWLGEETNVGAGTIERWITPINGIDHVTNPYPTGDQSREFGYSFIRGRDRETDAEFRRRFESELGAQGAASMDAIRASLMEMDGLRQVKVEENVTMTDYTSEGGLPPKSFRSTVLGDEHEDDIAQVLTDTRSAGIQSWGPYEGESITADGETRVERFEWAEEIDTYVTLSVTHDDDYPENGNRRVEDTVVEYIGGTTVAEDEFPGTGMGEDVVYDLVHNVVMQIPGVWRVDLFLGTDPNPDSTSDIVIDEKEAAMTSYDKVVVNSTYQPRP